MAASLNIDHNHSSVGIEAIYKWIQRKLGIDEPSFMKPDNIEEEDVSQNKYNPRYIAELLPEKDSIGQAVFRFSDINDYLILSSDGQLNVRGGEEDLFRAWGHSEFRDMSPHTVFQELEDKIVKIKTPVLGREFFFDSYNEFISWLRYKSGRNVSSV